MSDISIDMIKQLRALTGAGVTAVKEALEYSKGDEDKAMAYLREKGLSKATKRAGKAVTNGYIGRYIHNNGQFIVLVELGSETDFATKSPDFREFADKLALHVAANGTQYVTVDRIPADVIDEEKAAYKSDVEGKPAEVAEKILNGKLEKFYKENVLMRQELFGSEGITVEDAINELVVKIGEKIEIGKLVALQINKNAVIDLG